MNELADTLREADELAALLDAANASRAADGDRRSELEHIETWDTGESTAVELEHRIDDAGPGGFDGFDEVQVAGYFVDGELERVVLTHEAQVGPLAGAGNRYVHTGDEIEEEPLWIS